MVRTRTAAAALAAGGYVRLNGMRVNAASRTVKAGDVLTVALDRNVRVLQVVSFAERRGSAPEAAVLFADLTPPPAAATGVATLAAPAMREAGSGRPTKRDRREIDRFQSDTADGGSGDRDT